jgi:hypothetical protein
MTAQEPRSRQPKQLGAGTFQAEISSFALRLAAEGKAAKTIRTYTEAVQWFAAALPRQASRDPRCSDIDLWQREITVRGKGGKDRIVRIGHQAARSLDRYIRARSHQRSRGGAGPLICRLPSEAGAPVSECPSRPTSSPTTTS